MRLKKAFGILFTGSLLLLATEAPAMDKLTYDNVALSAEVYEMVPRDELRVTVNVFARGADRRAMADKVTEKVNKVFAAAKKHTGVAAELESRGARRSHEDDSAKDEWVDEARIGFKGKDFSDVYKLLAEVQEWAAITDMDFVVSEEKRDELEGELVKRGVGVFRDKADFVAKELGGSGYDMVEVTFEGDGSAPYYRARAMGAMNSEASMGAPSMDVDAGEEKLSMRVNGVVRIRR